MKMVIELRKKHDEFFHLYNSLDRIDQIGRGFVLDLLETMAIQIDALFEKLNPKVWEQYGAKMNYSDLVEEKREEFGQKPKR